MFKDSQEISRFLKLNYQIQNTAKMFVPHMNLLTVNYSPSCWELLLLTTALKPTPCVQSSDFCPCKTMSFSRLLMLHQYRNTQRYILPRSSIQFLKSERGIQTHNQSLISFDIIFRAKSNWWAIAAAGYISPWPHQTLYYNKMTLWFLSCREISLL